MCFSVSVGGLESFYCGGVPVGLSPSGVGVFLECQSVQGFEVTWRWVVESFEGVGGCRWFLRLWWAAERVSAETCPAERVSAEFRLE